MFGYYRFKMYMGDIPINFQLKHWLEQNKRNTLILLHEDLEPYKESSLELRQIYQEYAKEGQIMPIAKWLSDTKLADLKDFIRNY